VCSNPIIPLCYFEARRENKHLTACRQLTGVYTSSACWVYISRPYLTRSLGLEIRYPSQMANPVRFFVSLGLILADSKQRNPVDSLDESAETVMSVEGSNKINTSGAGDTVSP
jgi:hypothetical protein